LEQPGADAWIRQIASLDPAAVELYFGDQEYTWADLTSFAEALGQALAAAGTPPGAPVAWIARNHPSLVAGALGLLFGGYCISPINPHVPPAKLAEDVRAFNMAAVVAAPEDWTPDLIAAAREIGAAGFVLRLGSGDPVSAVEDLSRVPLTPQDRPALAVEQRLAVRRVLRHPGLAKVLLGQDVGRDPRPRGRHRDPLLAEHRRPVGVLDLGDPLLELDPRVRTLAFLGEPTGDSHALLLRNAGQTSTCARLTTANGLRRETRVCATRTRLGLELDGVNDCSYI